MSARRQQVSDAAVEVLAAGGLRALTHRAVDVQAGLPQGSTSNIFRTRAALVTGVIDRLAERDLAFMHELRDEPGGPEDGFGAADMETVIALLVRATTAMIGPPMDRTTRARMILAFEDSVDLGPQHRGMLVALMGVLTELGHPDPGPAARAVIDYVDGMMFHALTLDTRSVEPDEMAWVLRRILVDPLAAPDEGGR